MDDFWEAIKAQYVPQEPLLNLNNAAVSPPPREVEAETIRAYQLTNQNPDFNMWSRLDNALPGIKADLAEILDCQPSEIALNRNSSEGLSVAIFGLPLQAGDEILLSNWDYPSAIGGWNQRAQRDGILVKHIEFDLLDSDEQIIETYKAAITPHTKVIHLTHMLHWTGRVMPVQQICQLARQANILTLVDGAQTFAQMPVSFRQLGCDFFITSLHKWLGAPVGNGLLIIDSQSIAATWPLMAPFDDSRNSIDKFDHWNLGTYNSALQAGIPAAIRLHKTIGAERIHQRLNHLTQYWISHAQNISGFQLFTPIDERTGAIALFSIAGVDSKAIEVMLREKYQVHTKYRKHGQMEGIRVSPHFYTSESDLDKFVAALKAVEQSLKGKTLT